MQKLVIFAVWLVLFIVSFFLARLFGAILSSFAPPDAEVGYATIIGVTQLVVWIAILWLGMKTFRKNLSNRK
jgi:hypothetical protein